MLFTAHSEMPELFNSAVSSSVTDDMRLLIDAQPGSVPCKDIRYKTNFNSLPKNFDPRTPEGIPKEDVKSWFYKNSAGNLMPVICTFGCIDQAKCGSCWAFAGVVCFTSAARLNLNRLYGDRACYMSPFYQIVYNCTGESGIGKDEDIKIHAQETRNGISVYYTIAFSPKIRYVDKKPIIDNICEEEMMKYSELFPQTVKEGEVRQTLDEKLKFCTGCQGNIIASPLMLYTRPGGGAPTISSYDLYSWGCLTNVKKLRDRYCSEEYVENKTLYTIPPLYTADGFSYCRSIDLKNGNKPPGINSMTEFIMCSVYNYGPCVVGYRVYPSFLNFYKQNDKKNDIYTARVFIEDIKNSTQRSLGGHAVCIVGWGEELLAPKGEADKTSPLLEKASKTSGVPNFSDTDNKDVLQTFTKVPVKYWIVRNSWGEQWGDRGFFRIERNIDDELERLGMTERIEFEGQFGAIYFNPYPFSPTGPVQDSKESSGAEQHVTPVIPVNNMAEFLQPVANAVCKGYKENPEILADVDKNCSCRCGYNFDHATNQCKKATTAGAPQTFEKSLQTLPEGIAFNFKAPRTVMSQHVTPYIMIVLFILLIIVVILVLKSSRSKHDQPQVFNTKCSRYKIKTIK